MKAILAAGCLVAVLGLGGVAIAQSPTPVAPPPASPASPLKTVQMSEDDIKVTIIMIDECIKAKGRQCVDPGMMIIRKLEAALGPPAK